VSTRTITLVRHGEAAARWWEDPDPGLSEEGRRQAARLVGELASLRPSALLVSPLRRTRETADYLARHWGITPQVAPVVSEIPAPTDDVEERGRWLESVLSGQWSDMPPAQRVWRDELLEALRSLESDTVVVTHFVAINTVIGAATGDDRLVCERLGACSWTVVELRDGVLRLVTAGSGEPSPAR